jgi:NCS1 family nucleobase:cation symporter-1
MWPAFIGTMGTVFGIMAYAVKVNGGHASLSLIPSEIKLGSSERVFKFFYCISTIAGTYGGSSDRHADWARFSKTRTAYLPGAIGGMPVVITICALLGAITASATKAHYGTVYWQPLTYLQYVQKTEYTPGARAAIFFAGLAILGHQIFVNATQNNITAGMDVTGAFPRYISMRRGSLILIAIGILMQPWRFFTQAAIFLTAIGSFGVVTGPTTAILIVDYYILRKGNWKIPDLFKGGSESIYWYWHGINFRSLTVYVIAFIPALRKIHISLSTLSSTNSSFSWFGMEYNREIKQRSEALPA